MDTKDRDELLITLGELTSIRSSIRDFELPKIAEKHRADLIKINNLSKDLYFDILTILNEIDDESKTEGEFESRK